MLPASAWTQARAGLTSPAGPDSVGTFTTIDGCVRLPKEEP
jgi:hypothetical protein